MKALKFNDLSAFLFILIPKKYFNRACLLKIIKTDEQIIFDPDCYREHWVSKQINETMHNRQLMSNLNSL
jgi:hypothetical protein